MGRLLRSPSLPPRRLVILLGGFLCFLMLAPGVAAQTSPGPVSRPSISPPPRPAPPAMDQEQFLAYWTAETGWDTEIEIKNNQAAGEITVTPVLRSADGAETALRPVIIGPQEVKILSVSAAIRGVAPQLVNGYGSVVLRYRAPDAASVFAMAMIRGSGHPIAFHIDP